MPFDGLPATARPIRRGCVIASLILPLVAAAAGSFAEQPASPLPLAPPQAARAFPQWPPYCLEERLRLLEQQLEQQRRDQAALEAQLEALVKEKEKSDDAKKSKDGQPPAPYVVGSDLTMSASWKNGLELQSAHKDFRVHVGGRTQIDGVWLQNNEDAFRGTGGIGDQDSVNFRRARLRIDGAMYEFIDWASEYEFLNTANLNQGLEPATQNNANAVPCPTDVWIDIKELPVVGHLRIGNMKEPIGLEHQTSSRFLDFMERSFLQDAYTGPFNNGFTPGLMLWDTSANKRWHYDLGLFKNNSNIFAFGVGDGEYALDGRLTHLVWYDEPTEGRYLVHLGIAGSHRDTDDGRLRIRSRGSLRNGPPGPLNPIFVDTGNLFASQQDLIGLEGALVWGSWLVQSEYIASIAADTMLPNGNIVGTTYTNGYYVSVLYFLTGEHRAYDYDRAAFGRVVPYDNFFLARGLHGLCHGKGAWQIGARYDKLDLRDDGLHGGVLEDWTVGLNWFLNPNMKVQWNYVLTHREGPNNIGEGYINGFGARLAYDF